MGEGGMPDANGRFFHDAAWQAAVPMLWLYADHDPYYMISDLGRCIGMLSSEERLQRERDGQRKPRLQMLYLLVTQQARERQEVARLLGVHRNTISRWLARYAAGGLDALRATYIPPGKPISFAPEVLASLEQALHRPGGFASYEALRQWVRQTHGVEIKYKTLYTLVRGDASLLQSSTAREGRCLTVFGSRTMLACHQWH